MITVCNFRGFNEPNFVLVVATLWHWTEHFVMLSALKIIRFRVMLNVCSSWSGLNVRGSLPTTRLLLARAQIKQSSLVLILCVVLLEGQVLMVYIVDWFQGLIKRCLLERFNPDRHLRWLQRCVDWLTLGDRGSIPAFGRHFGFPFWFRTQNRSLLRFYVRSTNPDLGLLNRSRQHT